MYRSIGKGLTSGPQSRACLNSRRNRRHIQQGPPSARTEENRASRSTVPIPTRIRQDLTSNDKLHVATVRLVALAECVVFTVVSAPAFSALPLRLVHLHRAASPARLSSLLPLPSSNGPQGWSQQKKVIQPKRHCAVNADTRCRFGLARQATGHKMSSSSPEPREAICPRPCLPRTKVLACQIFEVTKF